MEDDRSLLEEYGLLPKGPEGFLGSGIRWKEVGVSPPPPPVKSPTFGYTRGNRGPTGLPVKDSTLFEGWLGQVKRHNTLLTVHVASGTKFLSLGPCLYQTALSSSTDVHALAKQLQDRMQQSANLLQRVTMYAVCVNVSSKPYERWLCEKCPE